MDASDVTLAILTGMRPRLLRQTLDGLPDGMLDSAHVLTLHNGGDDATVDVLDDFDIDLKMTNLDGLWPIGKASSHLLATAGAEKRPFVLYLQDDWLCRHDGDWLVDAMRVLDNEPRIGQVRLRLTNERAHIDHTSIHREKVRWAYLNGHRISENGDWTLNPFIARTEDVLTSFTDEKDAMRQFHKTGQIISQLVPGVFGHIGDKGQSLRNRADKERRLRRT